MIELLQANQSMEQDRMGNIRFGGNEVVGTVQKNSGSCRYDGVCFNNFTIKDGLNENGTTLALVTFVAEVGVVY